MSVPPAGTVRILAQGDVAVLPPGAGVVLAHDAVLEVHDAAHRGSVDAGGPDHAVTGDVDRALIGLQVTFDAHPVDADAPVPAVVGGVVPVGLHRGAVDVDVPPLACPVADAQRRRALADGRDVRAAGDGQAGVAVVALHVDAAALDAAPRGPRARGAQAARPRDGDVGVHVRVAAVPHHEGDVARQRTLPLQHDREVECAATRVGVDGGQVDVLAAGTIEHRVAQRERAGAVVVDVVIACVARDEPTGTVVCPVSAGGHVGAADLDLLGRRARRQRRNGMHEGRPHAHQGNERERDKRPESLCCHHRHRSLRLYLHLSIFG